MGPNYLKDLMQGASNAAASNVSAPVDGIAWALRKAGVPVPDAPLGSSDWMAQRGLTAKPQNYMMGLLGESVGGVLPMVAAAKAPQIANGLLGMIDNAATPRTLSRQAGVIEFPEFFTRPQKSESVKAIADDLAGQLNSKGFQASVEHSGSAAGPSSYVRVFDPETGRFFIDPVRVSDHSKGAIQSQFVHELRGTYDAPNFAKVIQAADDMRALGPGAMMRAKNAAIKPK